MSISLGGLNTQVAAKLPLSGGIVTGSLSSNSAITAATIGNAATVLYGNAAALSGIVAAGPTISTVTITNSGGTVIDDTAVDTAGGSYIKIVGSGFGAGAVVLIGTTAATSTTVLSSTQVLAQFGGGTSGTKDVFIVNTDGTAAVKPLAVTYSPFPAWSTSATLTSVTKTVAFSQTLSAPSDSTVTYTLNAGSMLPIGTALAESGVLSGAITETSTSDTTYSFTVQANDAENQNIPRTFSLHAGAFVARKVVASDKATNDIYGHSVAFSGDGTRVVVGAYGSDSGGLIDAGAAYIYIRSGSSWTLEQKIVASDKAISDNFGFSVAFSRDGNRVVVGARQHAPAAGFRSGAVYIFTRNNTTWTQEAKITPNSKVAGDEFGYSVAVSSDGSRVVSGAPSNDGTATNSGWAFIFVRSGTTWTQEQVIVPSVRVFNAQFGRSVSLSSDGSRVFIGAIGSSAVYMYNRSGSVWSQEIKLDGETGGSSFGISVSLSGDGNRVVVGAENEGVNYSGAAYAYIWNGTAWTLEQKIVPSDIQGNDKFGSSVSFSEDASRVVIGSRLSDPGGTNGAGAAYVFTRSGTTWTQEAKIFAADKTSTGGYADVFGYSVSFSDGSHVVVGAPYSSHGGTAQAGAAYVFSRSGTTWSPSM